MSTTESQGKGVLVIHDDNAAAWLSPLAPAVASVRIAVGRGAEVEVDAANPTLVMGWALQAGGDVEALAGAISEPELADGLAKLVATGQDVFVKSAPTLTEPWVRRATVAAVAQCTVRPINEGALLLDQASADEGTGRTEIAASLFRMAAPALLALGEECLAGYIGGGAAQDLSKIAGVAAQSLIGSGWEPDVAEMASQLVVESALSDELLRDVMESFVAEWKPVLVGHAGDWSGEDVIGQWIDPYAVPARLLAWSGADEADLVVTPQPGSDRVTVSTKLARSADPRSVEASELIAYAADPESGAVLAIAPLHVEGRALVATLVCRRPARDVHFGVYHGDKDPARLRADHVGRLSVKVDRRMLDAYNHHRLALVAIQQESVTANVAAMEAARDRHLDLARDSAEQASDAITDFLDQNGALSEETVTVLQRRQDAIDAYVVGLDSDVVVPPGSSPLLTELLPVDGDSAADDDVPES